VQAWCYKYRDPERFKGGYCTVVFKWTVILCLGIKAQFSRSGFVLNHLTSPHSSLPPRANFSRTNPANSRCPRSSPINIMRAFSLGAALIRPRPAPPCSFWQHHVICKRSISSLEDITEDDRTRIYIDGAGNYGLFLAFYLRSMPRPPPVTLLVSKAVRLEQFDRVGWK